MYCLELRPIRAYPEYLVSAGQCVPQSWLSSKTPEFTLLHAAPTSLISAWCDECCLLNLAVVGGGVLRILSVSVSRNP